jgi:cohesin complex subunit SCC1
VEVPPHVLKKGLFSIVNKNIYYPAPLLDSWIKSTQPPLDSPSGLYRLSLSLSLSLSLKLLNLDIERVKQNVTNIIILCS